MMWPRAARNLGSRRVVSLDSKVSGAGTAAARCIAVRSGGRCRHSALRGTELKYLELAETLNLSRWAFLRDIVLPGALPGFMLGLRFAVMGAWLALVVVEQLNATSGIGYMIDLARTYAQTDVIVVGLVVYALLGLGSDAVVRLIQTRALAWQRTVSR